jgi:hypothetical protein
MKPLQAFGESKLAQTRSKSLRAAKTGLKVDETRLRGKQRADGERQVLALLDAEIAKEAMRKAKELAK